MKTEEQGRGAEIMQVGLVTKGLCKGGKVEGAVVLVNLDGVAAAECDVGAGGTGQVFKDAGLVRAANGAGGVGCGGRDFGVAVGPQVDGKEGAAGEVRLAGEEFEGFGGLEGGGEIDGHAEDAGGVAGLYRAGGRSGEQAGQAGGGEVRGVGGQG